MSAPQTFTCASDFSNLLSLSFSASGTRGTLDFSHPSGSASYTNPDGEELKFAKAQGTFKVLIGGSSKSIAISWKPLGKKTVREVVELTYGEGGKAESYKVTSMDEGPEEE